MNALLLEPAELKLLSDVAKPYSLVVVFDDLVARQEAVQIYSHLVKIYSRLAKRGRDDFDIECNWWQFDDLTQNKQGAEAAKVAGHADMVMIVCAKSEELPSSIKVWVEMWLAKKGEQDTALVAMVGVANRQNRPTTAVHSYLEHVARETGMNFFPALFQLAKETPTDSIEAIVAHAKTVTLLIEEILRHGPSPRWGRVNMKTVGTSPRHERSAYDNYGEANCRGPGQFIAK